MVKQELKDTWDPVFRETWGKKISELEMDLVNIAQSGILKTPVCVHWYASRNQRETERARGEGDEGTSSYKNKGCYDCDGKNKEEECSHYFPKRREK